MKNNDESLAKLKNQIEIYPDFIKLVAQMMHGGLKYDGNDPAYGCYLEAKYKIEEWRLFLKNGGIEIIQKSKELGFINNDFDDSVNYGISYMKEHYGNWLKEQDRERMKIMIDELIIKNDSNN